MLRPITPVPMNAIEAMARAQQPRRRGANQKLRRATPRSCRALRDKAPGGTLGNL
jgi:hypothetical protein